MLHGNVPSWREFITIISSSSILAVVLTSPFLQIKRNSDLELGFVIWEYYSKVRWKCVFFLPHSNCNICQTSHLIWTVINNVLCIWEYAKKKKKKKSVPYLQSCGFYRPPNLLPETLHLSIHHSMLTWATPLRVHTFTLKHFKGLAQPLLHNGILKWTL